MHATEHSVRLEQISQERFIQAPIEAVYDYVTQPDRWHEWHPTSLSADTGTTDSSGNCLGSIDSASSPLVALATPNPMRMATNA